jgi:dihydroorotase
VSKENILYKCGWSPFEGTRFSSKVKTTFVNGTKVYDQGKVIENNTSSAQSLKFSR